MIFTDRTITVRKGESRIDEPIVVYRGDYELEVRFTILNSRFKFMSGTNMIESEKASYGQLAILTPYGGNIFSDIVRCNDGSVTFVLTADMLNQIEEVGLYSFQIRLMDYNKESRVSIPPIEFGIEVREPIASEDHDNSVNNAIVGYSIAKVVDPKEENVGDTFDESGNYNKTKWETGDRISEGKLNKIEDAIDKINQNEKNDSASLSKRIDNNFNVLDTVKADKNEIFSMENMGQDVKEAMTGGSVAVVGVNTILSENIVNDQVTPIKLHGFMHGNNLNLLDKSLFKYGYYYNGSTGAIIAGKSESGLDFITPYIPIKPNTTYTANVTRYNYIFFDANLNKIGNGIGGMSFTTPENTAYVGLSFRSASSEHDPYKLYLFEGATLPSGFQYHDYEFIMDGLSTNERHVHNCILQNGNTPINYNTSTKQLDLSTLIIIYKNEFYKVPEGAVLDLSYDSTNTTVYSTLAIYIDWETKEIKTLSNDRIKSANSKNWVPLLGMRIRGDNTDFIPAVKFTINGKDPNERKEWSDMCILENGNTPINYNTSTKQLDLSTLIIIYKNKFYKVPDGTVLDLSGKDAVGYDIYTSGVVYIDWNTKEIKFISNDGHKAADTSGLVPVLGMRIRGNDTDFVPAVKFTINGKDVSGGVSFLEGPAALRVDTVFLRNGSEQIYHANNISGTTTVRLTTKARNFYWRFVDNSYSDIVLSDEWKDFELEHNKCLVFDHATRELLITTFGGSNRVTDTQIILLLNISGKLNGRLMGSVVYDNNDIIENNTKRTVMSGKECLFFFKCEFTKSYLSDFCFVGDELWCFAVSNDDHTDTAEVVRYSIDYENKQATKLGSFTHNFGHANTVDYCENLDCLILGNGGSASNTQPNEFYIFPNASSFKDLSAVTIAKHGMVFDVSQLGWGKQVNVVWGESNRGRHNIAYVISNDGSTNRYIMKILLGQGNAQLEHGTFIKGKGYYEFNGTFKILGTWPREWIHLEFNNGSDFYDGVIYEGLGGGLWWAEHKILEDGTTDTTIYKDMVYTPEGEIESAEAEGITVNSDYLILGDVAKNIYIYKK